MDMDAQKGKENIQHQGELNKMNIKTANELD